MAQAARLNLRMQKELKLLLTDPPPGASFPSLSDDSSASLTSIDANFKGPEGTVYDNGVFKIRIQIPERYPFQPPIVTFATPIYHPNIDTGGRICLDILNLPPKGSWQPSLNISTVLTSIGLLLSEPNPDDGLMHDASREYKYNRQAFDQKARSMTDKYARAGESDISFGSQDSQAHMCPSTSKAETKASDVSIRETEKPICQKRFGSKMKLSLESLGSGSKQDSSKEMCNKSDYSYPKNHINSGELNKAKTTVTEIDRNPYPEKQQGTKNKLLLKVPAVPSSANVESTRTNTPNPSSSTMETRNTSMDSPDRLPLMKCGVNHVEVSEQNHDFTGKCGITVNQEMQSLESVKMSQQSKHSDETTATKLNKAKTTATEIDRNPYPDKQQATKNKLSLKVPVASNSGNVESTRTNISNHCSSNLETRNTSMGSPDLLPLMRSGVNHVKVSVQDHDFTGKCGITVNQEMQSLESVTISQKSRHSDEKLQHAVSASSYEGLSCLLSTRHNEINPQKNASDGNASGSSVIKRQKVGTVRPRTSLVPIGRSDNEKENLAPYRPPRLKLPPQINLKREPAPENGNHCNGGAGMQALSVARKPSVKDAKLPLEPVDGFIASKCNLKLNSKKPLSLPSKVLNTRHEACLDEKQQVCQVNVVESTAEFKKQSIGSPVPEATIVLDSEDSEDENVPVRSKLSLARKRLSLKRKHV